MGEMRPDFFGMWNEFFALCQQKDLLELSPVDSGFLMGIVEDIDMVSFDAASPVLGRVNHTVDQYLAAVGDSSRINSDGVIC